MNIVLLVLVQNSKFPGQTIQRNQLCRQLHHQPILLRSARQLRVLPEVLLFKCNRMHNLNMIYLSSGIFPGFESTFQITFHLLISHEPDAIQLLLPDLLRLQESKDLWHQSRILPTQHIVRSIDINRIRNKSFFKTSASRASRIVTPLLISFSKSSSDNFFTLRFITSSIGSYPFYWWRIHEEIFWRLSKSIRYYMNKFLFGHWLQSIVEFLLHSDGTPCFNANVFTASGSRTVSGIHNHIIRKRLDFFWIDS